MPLCQPKPRHLGIWSSLTGAEFTPTVPAKLNKASQPGDASASPTVKREGSAVVCEAANAPSLASLWFHREAIERLVAPGNQIPGFSWFAFARRRHRR